MLCTHVYNAECYLVMPQVGEIVSVLELRKS